MQIKYAILTIRAKKRHDSIKKEVELIAQIRVFIPFSLFQV